MKTFIKSIHHHYLIILFLLLGLTTKNTLALKILSTTLFIHDSLVQILGDKKEFLEKNKLLELHYLLGPGTDPHIYIPSATDLINIRKADLIIYHGLRLEGKMSESLNGLRRRNKSIDLSEKLDHSRLIKIPNSDDYDPHIWFDPLLWHQANQVLLEKLIEYFPQFKVELSSNYLKWKERLKKIISEGKNKLSTVPENQRILVTSHDAFNYFSRTFNLTTESIQGVSTESQVGLGDISRIVKIVESKKIKSIFIENSISPSTMEKVKELTKVKIGGILYTDALGKIGGEHQTLEQVLQYNVDTIYNGLK